MTHAFAVVRNGRELIAAGRSLDQAMAQAAQSFYGPTVPPFLEVLEQGVEPLPPLVAIPCSEALLAASGSVFGPGAMTVLYGILCLEEEAADIDEEQLSLF